MAIKLNSAEKCEVIVITIDKNQHPIAWGNMKQSLVNSGLTEENAENHLTQNNTIEMELHYDPELGAFLVESDSIESTPIYNPYTGEEMEVEEDNED